MMIEQKLKIKRKREIKKEKRKIKAPDFDQFISREEFDKINDKTLVIPFSLPNYKYIRAKPIMMVIYNKKKT